MKTQDQQKSALQSIFSDEELNCLFTMAESDDPEERECAQFNLSFGCDLSLDDF